MKFGVQAGKRPVCQHACPRVLKHPLSTVYCLCLSCLVFPCSPPVHQVLACSPGPLPFTGLCLSRPHIAAASRSQPLRQAPRTVAAAHRVRAKFEKSRKSATPSVAFAGSVALQAMHGILELGMGVACVPPGYRVSSIRASQADPALIAYKQVLPVTLSWQNRRQTGKEMSWHLFDPFWACPSPHNGLGSENSEPAEALTPLPQCSIVLLPNSELLFSRYTFMSASA